MKITKKQAKKLSLIKWHWLRDNPCNVIKEIMNDGSPDGSQYFTNYMPRGLLKEIEGLGSECGCCQYYLEQGNGWCDECPIGIKDMGCKESNSLFLRYGRASQEQRSEIAQKIIDILEAWEV